MVDVNTNPLYYAAVGGVILGIATSLNYCLRGKVTGMSGIIFGLTSCKLDEFPEKLSIVGGMLVASGIFFDIFGYGTHNNFTPFGPEYLITAYTSYLGYALAGLLVGFGTKLGNGCTSGHGLCGLPRFSIRSIVAVCTFLSTAIGIATLSSYQTLGPFTDQSLNPQTTYEHMYSSNLGIVIGVLMPIIGGIMQAKRSDNMETGEIGKDQMITWATGLLFGTGLLVSGMVRRINIIGFLAMHDGWNPSLLFVLGCGVGVNLITFNYMIRVRKQSFLGKSLFNPSNSTIDWKLILGAACFGLGWGIGGLCPGPAIAMFSCFNIQIHLVWFVCLIIGQQAAAFLEKQLQSKAKNEDAYKAVGQNNLNQEKLKNLSGHDSERVRVAGSPPELGGTINRP